MRHIITIVADETQHGEREATRFRIEVPIRRGWLERHPGLEAILRGSGVPAD